MDSAVLEIRHLSVSFATSTGPVGVVDDVCLTIPRGKTVALVGESGCGKSVTALSILRLLPQPPARIEGEILFRDSAVLSHVRDRGVSGAGSTDGHDILRMTDHELTRLRGGKIAMVFQDPMSSLNPVFTVGEQIVECVELHTARRGRDAWDRAIEILGRVGIPNPGRCARDFPHRLSGGMRQRAMIAMALACEPVLLIADEPTTALDVTVQLQILELLQSLQSQTGLSLLLITHDFGVVSEIAEEVHVMYAGRIVERASTTAILSEPRHPYTQALLRCTPRLASRTARLDVIPGNVPMRGQHPPGCRFHPRCNLTRDRAAGGSRDMIAVLGSSVLRRCVESVAGEPSEAPVSREIAPGHHVACWEVDGSFVPPDLGSPYPPAARPEPRGSAH